MANADSSTEALYSTLGTDPDLSDIVAIFVDQMPERTDQLRDLLAAADWEGLFQAAHQLKGAAGSYGFQPITPIAAHLEHAIDTTRPEEEIRQAVDALIAVCRSVRAGGPS